MKKKRVHFTLTWLLSWAPGIQCTQGQPLERGGWAYSRECGVLRDPRWQSSGWPLGCSCRRGQGTLRSQPLMLALVAPPQDLHHPPIGDPLNILSHKASLGCQEISKQPLLFLALYLCWFPSALLVWQSVSPISVPGWLSRPGERKKYLMCVSWTDLLLHSHAAPTALVLATITSP